MSHRLRERDDFQELQAGPRRPTRTQHQLPRSEQQPLHRQPRHPARADPLRRSQRRLLPLTTNDRVLSDADVLGAYRYQPNLERRHHLLKSVQDAAPVLLHSPARIEALFCCQFLALLISALIEREVRVGMQHADLTKIRLYPEFRNCTSPSTERILEIFATLSRHQLHHDGAVIKTFHPELTAQQEQVLELMDLAPGVYRQLT